MFQTTWSVTDAFPGAIGFVCTSWLCPLSALGGETSVSLNLCILHSQLEERMYFTVHYKSYLNLDNWELGMMQNTDCPTGNVLVYVQHTTFPNNHSNAL